VTHGLDANVPRAVEDGLRIPLPNVPARGTSNRLGVPPESIREYEKNFGPGRLNCRSAQDEAWPIAAAPVQPRRLSAFRLY